MLSVCSTGLAEAAGSPMKFGNEPPPFVAATVTLGAGVSAALVCEGKLPAFLTTICSTSGLTAGASLAAARDSDTFRELFVFSSVLLRAPESSATVIAGADFPAAFGSRVVCEFGEGVFAALEADVVGEDSAG